MSHRAPDNPCHCGLLQLKAADSLKAGRVTHTATTCDPCCYPEDGYHAMCEECARDAHETAMEAAEHFMEER